MVTRMVELPGDKIEVHADIGTGRVVRAILMIEEPAAGAEAAKPANELTFAEWEKLFDEMCALAPLNEHPADVSRESMYMSDEEIRDRNDPG
jgi:hypothetical protein